MAHLAANYKSFDNFLDQADAFWTVDLTALNSSGVKATAILASNTEDDGTSYLNVAISGTGLTPNQTHVQHVHGLFDDSGNPINSTSPTIANDTDRDGLVEVLEGLSSYGDILLPLSSDGMMPMADATGRLSFIANYDLGDDSNFFSPVSMTDYTAADIMPLFLREVVLHGVEIPDGIGEGTDGEADGGVNGYLPILPAASGEIEVSTLAEAKAMLSNHRATASDNVFLTNGADFFDGGLGDDRINGLSGNDVINGGAGDDTIIGGAGDDTLSGGEGDDMIFGDGVYSLNPQVFTGQLYRLYQASFDRDPDLQGFHGWASELGTGQRDLDGIAAGFTGSQEFKKHFDAGSNEEYVTALYRNVLDRSPDAAGLENWTNRLDDGASRADVLVGFSQSREFINSSSIDLTQWVKDQGEHDVLEGNGGNNILSGGYFADTFIFGTAADSSHTVTDFESWDMLDFSAFGYTEENEVRANMTQQANNVIFADQDVVVTLEHTQLNTLGDDMFIV